jgi:hypothetical protein
MLGEGQDRAGRVETRRRERCSLTDTVCYCVRKSDEEFRVEGSAYERVRP